MSIDELARAAAVGARRRATADVDPTVMLRQLHTTNRRRRAVALASVLAVVLGGSFVVRASMQDAGRASTIGSNPSDSPSTPSPSTHSSSSARSCPAGETCQVSGRTYVVGLPTPMRMKFPDNFQTVTKQFGPQTVEVYRGDVDSTGVTVMEGATPVRNDMSATPDPKGGANASEMAIWLSNRPFLEHTKVDRVSLGGLVAWRVTGDFRSGSVLGFYRSGPPRAPVFANEFASVGFSDGLKGECTLVDTLGSGVTVVWSWTYETPKSAILANRSFVAGLSFG